MSPLDHSRSAKYSPITGNSSSSTGLGAFLKRKWIAVLSAVCGVALCLFVFFYINWLSNQRFGCPEWAVECDIHSYVSFFNVNAAVLQGVFTTTYHVGIVAIAYSLSVLAEVAIWPLLHQDAHRFVDIDSYLTASRGSFISALRSLAAARSFGMAILLVIAILSIAGQQISGIVVGWALHPTNVTAVYRSQYTPGGGLGLPFMQYYPGPAPSPAGVEEAISLYTIWSASPKTEPLPQVADFILDRITLGRIGNISIQAPRIRRVIACSPRSVKLQSVDNTQRAIVSYEVETKYSLRKFSEIHTGTSKPWPIRVRQQPGLTSWIHEATMLSPTRSNMTVIFGSFNDHIENSSTVEVSGNTNFSALACNIDIELQDDTAIIGHLNAPRLTSISQNLGSVTNLTNSFFLPVWLGAATTFIGGSVAGLQPTYGKDPSGWPSPRYTSYGSVEGWNNSAVWSISDITEFMDHSQSALAQGIAGSWRDKDDVLMLDSEFSDLRISSYRTYILLLPVGILIATCIGLLATNTLMHRQTDIFGMQTAELSLLIYRTQNVTYLQKKAEVMTAEEFSMLQVQLHKGNDSVYLSTPASISS